MAQRLGLSLQLEGIQGHFWPLAALCSRGSHKLTSTHKHTHTSVYNVQGTMVHTFNPSAWEADRPLCFQGRHGLHT